MGLNNISFLNNNNMNILFMGIGGLLNFNATLPTMAIQFILFVILLILIFYIPVAKILKKRKKYLKHKHIRLNAWVHFLSSKIDVL
uniref:Truncated CF0 subunit II of ATP synthase n=1 Tax=Karlodinium veneficum TaxID=407301 RepID=G1E774_KARVE|nr:truncated CF0 subunit II of ATP synthase [Karlodinium veneficum]